MKFNICLWYVKQWRRKMMAVTEEALLELTATYSEQIEEMIPDDDNLDECRALYQKYMEAHEQLLTMDFDKYADKAVDAYYTLMDIYFALGQLGLENVDEDEEAEKEIKFLTKILNIHKKQAQKDAKYLKTVAGDYEEIGEVYEDIGNEKKAGKMYDKADKIMESIKG